MINRRAFLLLPPVGILGACTTVPEGQSMTLQPVAADKANIYIYRHGRFFDQFKSCEIELNQQPQGLLYEGSYLLFQLPAGKHFFKAKSGFLIPSHGREITAEAGKNYFLEVEFSYTVAGLITFTSVHIFPVQQDKALRVLSVLKNALELAPKN